MAINLDAPFVVLRASDGEFVCAEGGGGQEVVANRSQRGPWETFTFHHRTDKALHHHGRRHHEVFRQQRGFVQGGTECSNSPYAAGSCSTGINGYPGNGY